MTDKIVRFPIVQGGKDCDEANVMVLLGQAADAQLEKIVIAGVGADGEFVRLTNLNETEAVAMHESAKLHYFFEG